MGLQINSKVNNYGIKNLPSQNECHLKKRTLYNSLIFKDFSLLYFDKG